jgi:hypothetical protein
MKMEMHCFLLSLAATALAMAMLAGLAQAAPIRECGNYPSENNHWTYRSIRGAGIGNVTSRRIACAEARHIVLHVRFGRRAPYRPHYPGWSCRYVRQGYEFADIRCTASGGRVVRWQAGA